MLDFDNDPELLLIDEIDKLEEQNKFEEAWELRKKIKFPASTLLFMKLHLGKSELLKKGLNLENAEKEYGKDWLDKVIVSPQLEG